MTGTESTDLNQTIDKCVWDNFERWFGECNFPSRNILQLKETLEVWYGEPQDVVYDIIPNFALILLRLKTVKNRAAHC